MREMRNSKRQVTDEKRIDDIIMSCDCCRLGLVDGDEAYIVPLNFAYVKEDGKRVFYFHGASEGRKIDLIKANGKAGFEMDTNHALMPADTACNFSFAYQCVIGTGKISLVEDREKKAAYLNNIMKHYSDKNDWEFKEAVVDATAVIRLEVREISCKEIPAMG